MTNSKPSSSGSIKGSCACGRISYKANSKPLTLTACHCKPCQQISGGPYLAFASFKAKDIEWSQKPDMWRASDFAERGFCRECGSAISMQYDFEPESIGTTVGTIDEADPPLPALGSHIFLDHKMSSFVLADDGAKRYARFNPGFEDQIERWRRDRSQGQNKTARL